MITLVNVNRFSPNLVGALILWRSGLGLLMGQFLSEILMELSARDMPIFSFPDDILSKCQGILIKPGTCIDMMEIWFGIANGQISSMFDRVIYRNMIMAGYYSLTFLFFQKIRFNISCRLCHTGFWNCQILLLAQGQVNGQNLLVQPRFLMKYYQQSFSPFC